MSLEQLESSSQNQGEAANENEKYGAKCFVESNGQVNCSEVIYEDEKSWRKSRHQIDLLIHVLKNKIVELKDIRKHLNDHKPVTIKEDDDVMGLFSQEASTEKLSKVSRYGNSTTTKRSNKHHHHHNHHNHHENSGAGTTRAHSAEISSISTLSFSTITVNPATITTLRSVIARTSTNPSYNTSSVLHGSRGAGSNKRPHKESANKNGTLHEIGHRKNVTRHSKHSMSTNRNSGRVNTTMVPSKRTTAVPTTTTTTMATTNASTTISPFSSEEESFRPKEEETSENFLGSSTTVILDAISPSTQSSVLSLAADDVSRTLNSIDNKLASTYDYNDTMSTLKPHRHIYGDLDVDEKREHTECFCEPEAEV